MNRAALPRLRKSHSLKPARPRKRDASEPRRPGASKSRVLPTTAEAPDAKQPHTLKLSMRGPAIPAPGPLLFSRIGEACCIEVRGLVQSPLCARDPSSDVHGRIFPLAGDLPCHDCAVGSINAKPRPAPIRQCHSPRHPPLQGRRDLYRRRPGFDSDVETRLSTHPRASHSIQAASLRLGIRRAWRRFRSRTNGEGIVQRRFVEIPLWPVAVLSAILPVMWFDRRSRRASTTEPAVFPRPGPSPPAGAQEPCCVKLLPNRIILRMTFSYRHVYHSLMRKRAFRIAPALWARCLSCCAS